MLDEANGEELLWLPFCHWLILPATKATLSNSHLGLKVSGHIFLRSTAQWVPNPFKTLLVSAVMVGTKGGECFPLFYILTAWKSVSQHGPASSPENQLGMWTLACPQRRYPPQQWETVGGEGCRIPVLISLTRADHNLNVTKWYLFQPIQVQAPSTCEVSPTM